MQAESLHHKDHVPPLYRGVTAQCSFSARLRHCRSSGFSITSTSCGLRRMTTLSPLASFVLAWPSQKSVVPGFTREATTTMVPVGETTTGRNDKLCGQMGVMHMQSTSGL